MSRQARKRRRRHNHAGATRVLFVGGGVLAGALVIGAVVVGAYVATAGQSAPALSRLQPRLVGGTSAVFASDGTRLGFIQADQLRTPVGWNEIPTDLKNATVALEAHRFYKHNGDA